MFHVFICYPRTYLAQVSPLHDALELALRNIYQRDAQVFQDTSDLQAANKWESDINTALEDARVMIVVVVPTILESPQCRREMLRFIDTPGKHIIPLICEEVPRLQQLAESIGEHPEGSEEHEIAVCAHALRTWQTYDFSQAVYQNPNEAAYKISIAELARMIRNKLDFEDHAVDAGQDREPEPTPSPAPQPQGPGMVLDAAKGGDMASRGGTRNDGTGPDESGDHETRKTRGGLWVAVLAVLVLAGGIGYWIMRPPVEPEDKLDRARADALLDRVLEQIASQDGAEHLSFDRETGALRIAAPPVGKVATSIALQPAIDRVLKAGFVPGFSRDTRDGRACFAISGDPLRLEGNDLSDGEYTSLDLRVYERTETRIQKICMLAESTWRPLSASKAVVDSGAILAAPRDDAPQFRTLRRGQEVPAPFWTNNDVPGWVRMEYRDKFAYIPRDLILQLK